LTAVASVAAGVWLFRAHLALWNLPYDCTNVDFGFMSRKQLEAGDPDVAEWCARQYSENRPYQVRPQANLVDILYRIGKTNDARAEFETLRDLAGTADLDCPPLARLAPIAREFGYPTDWRRPESINKLLTGRRPLPSLGPLLWRPWTAPDWKLKDSEGRTHSLAEFRGKPVLMIFFLGRGCLHCKQQLEVFAKKSRELSAAGLTVIAVSTDDEKGIRGSLADYKPAPFPFLMLSDPKSQVFQAFRAYDDFEQITLHGTILIDADGFVRWHDESFEPFMDVDFVITEANRLLARPLAPVEPGARMIATEEAKDSLPTSAVGQRD
jgi:peroxiredoxin